MQEVGEEALGLLTVGDVAHLLKVSKATVWRRIYAAERGEPGLESVKDGGSRRVTPAALRRYIQARENRNAAHDAA